MAPRLCLGGSNSTNRSGIGGESPQIQTHIQRPTQIGVELARGTEQRGSGVHDPSPYRHGRKRSQHSKQEVIALESARAHTRYEQRHEIRCPSPQPANEARNRKLDLPRIQEPSGEHTSLASSGTQKAFHQARHLDLGDHAIGRHCTNPRRVNKTRRRPGRSPAMRQHSKLEIDRPPSRPESPQL